MRSYVLGVGAMVSFLRLCGWDGRPGGGTVATMRPPSARFRRRSDQAALDELAGLPDRLALRHPLHEPDLPAVLQDDQGGLADVPTVVGGEAVGLDCGAAHGCQTSTY